MRSIGMVEFNSIGRGIEAADFMAKAAQVELTVCNTVCPGKYIVLVSGDVAAVQSSVQAGVERGKETVVDQFILPNVHPSVFPAINCTSGVDSLQALGIIETYTIASLIVAADAAAKAAEVELIEIRTGIGIGGKSFVTLTGDVGAVKAAVESGVASTAESGLLVSQIVIPSPSKLLYPYII
ncbi:microcompartments protein [Desulforamulus reducens MI-1]|uniref:Microcompartments protein n=1 Tax=Desulforamulus reducens (strain ATCC BAA-1160 / DSM 100696 / MI-1) TaxID=349161 RepID=A4J434_DESRM|nr:BMC domain-containing protein [Desulforamulus reducens]ABO49837.1 microcompartments protein [Desulforamulus reducens MI-1]